MKKGNEENSDNKNSDDENYSKRINFFLKR